LIVTLTVNPAIDRTFAVDRLVFEDRAYILSRTEGAGGRGFNASRVIHSFGGKTIAIITAGGQSGECLREFVATSPFAVEMVPIAAETRTNLTVTDKNGLTVKLNERGPEISPEELNRVEAAVRPHLPKALWLLLCGSLPPGVPGEFYAKLIHLARQFNVKTLLDTDGEPLEVGLEAKPTVVTPNQQEAERLLNRALLTRSHFLDAVERIRHMGADSVVLSLGSRGAMGGQENLKIEVIPPRIDAVCPIGAGDALAASFAWAMTKKNDFADAIRWGVAAGTASAKLPGISYASLQETQETYRLVVVRKAD
jgi:1-phosphofructokinase family hexose kinase